MLHHGHDWWLLFSWQALSWAFWGFLARAVILRGERDFQRGSARTRSIDGALCLAVAATHTLLSAGILVLLQPFQPIQTMDLRAAVNYLLVPWTLVDALLYALLYFLGRSWASQAHARALALRESRLETELARAQLEALRLKMQPHFLFNTLNSIAALVRKGSNPEALEMVLGLSLLLRRSLDRSDEQQVTLREELDFARSYVDLHLRRFPDRLRYETDVPDELLEEMVPSLLLQPLLENAIRHAVAPSDERVTVRLEASRAKGGGLRLAVTDDGPGLPTDFSPERYGVGLATVDSRLALLYDDARLLLETRASGGTRADVELPAQLATLPDVAEGLA